MKLPRRRFLQLATGAIASPAVQRVARAQAYPSRPVTIVVPYAAGGPTDTIARVVAEGMRSALQQPVIIENVTGAAGTIGVGRVARAAPDGYTISIGQWGSHVTNGAIYALPYDLLKDFAPISLVAIGKPLIVSRQTIPAKDLRDLIAWLKANADKATQGTAGAGSPQHISGLYFQQEAGVRYQFVPYRGVAPAIQDMIAGQIDFMIDQATNSLPQVRAGKVKAYAVTAKDRLAAAPDIPTACPGSTSPSGKDSGCRKIHRVRSSQRSILQWWMRSGAQLCINVTPILCRKSPLATSRRLKLSGCCKRPRSRNGGPSSKRLTSKANNATGSLIKTFGSE